MSVLSMMFLVLFGSLTAAMAIASQGNIKTATTHLHVMRAMSSAETGLAIAKRRLAEAASRFVISHSQMDESAVDALWNGNLNALGTHLVLPPPSGHAEGSSPSGLAEAISLIHASDEGVVLFGDVMTPVITSAPTGADLSVYKADGWVVTPIVALEEMPLVEGVQITQPAFQVVYAPLANGTDIRVIVTGYDFAYRRSGQPLTRVIMQDVRLVKRVNHAVISPSRIMIGKNVQVTGDLGARFDDLNWTNGDPMVVKSDFYGLDPQLDRKLDDFYAAVAAFDVDHDNRLRVGHPVEGAAIPDKTGADYGGDPDHSPFADVTGDGYVCEFDIFINHFDRNGDGRVMLSDALRAGTPNEHETAEFVTASGDPIDDDLALLIDSWNPDRNRNGIFGFLDLNYNGVWDAGIEPLLDYDPDTETFRDQALGYRDGAICRLDRYTKVRGSLSFRTSQAAWTNAHGGWNDVIRGAIRPNRGDTAMQFGLDDSRLPNISADSFSDSENALRAAANGDDFWVQVAENLGTSVSSLADYVEVRPESSPLPRYIRVDPDTTGDGLPDNADWAYFEKAPFGSPAHNDWYYRPIFQNMVFRNVKIPQGVNGLFINCTFVGVTHVRTHVQNTHPYWTIYGQMEMDSGTGRPAPVITRWIFGDDPDEMPEDAPPELPASAIPPNANILMASSPLDWGDLPLSMRGAFPPSELAKIRPAIIIDGQRVTDTKLYSNNCRFHDCLFVGSIVSDTPQAYTHVRNKLQFTGKTRFTQRHPEQPENGTLNPSPGDLAEIAKSSMMLPNYSVDIGSFNSPPEQNVALRGVIVAGVLDIRGNASIDGALLLTFRPVSGEGPLVDIAGNPVGNPAGFNATLGYFGPEDGDGESLDPATLPIVDGQRIVGWDVNGDGMADVGPFDAPPPGATAVPFHGYGRISLRFDPNMMLPNGIMLPIQVDPLAETYAEGYR
ncbi:MAG: hypothetical protein KF866_00865 [Phycisphaeraceae bacterium]|nr:hypothetical protein [Phycisphaeraceae bacterium]MCW5755105.1 hypothetical protein [Phycisphaeraceae bacterium]